MCFYLSFFLIMEKFNISFLMKNAELIQKNNVMN